MSHTLGLHSNKIYKSALCNLTMNKSSKNKLSGFEAFRNVIAKVKINMTLENKYVKKLDEDGFDDVREIEIEKDVEFGINDLGNDAEISFELGTIKVNKARFDEALKRYLDRNKFIKNLKN